MQNNSTYIAALIKRQWIRDEYVASDLFTLDVIDADFTGGYKPMILTMESLRDILIESISFIDLPDTPSTYAGASGQVPIVNSAENALEFIEFIEFRVYYLRSTHHAPRSTFHVLRVQQFSYTLHYRLAMMFSSHGVSFDFNHM